MPLAIPDLRDLEADKLVPLMDEEAKLWVSVLGWDYAPTQRFLLRYIRRKHLPGLAVVSDGRLVAYAYMLLDGERGIIGGVFVARDFWGQGLEKMLALGCAQALKETSGVARIESQLMLFSGADIEEDMRIAGFEVFRRHFLAIDPSSYDGRPPCPPGFSLQPWSDDIIHKAAELIFESYEGGVDAYFSSSFASLPKCREFVNNLALHQGCGDFLPRMTTDAVDSEARLAGVVIATRLAPRSGHLPQISVLPRHQGSGVGTYLVAECLRRFARRGYKTVSLTVTEANERAEKWYRRLGFREIVPFNAYFWRRE